MTRDKVLEAAVELFARHGYEGTSMNAIASHCGITKPAVYYYFKNKDELYGYILEYVFEMVLAGLEQIAQTRGSLNEMVYRVLKFNFDFATRNTELLRIAYSVAFDTRRICGQQEQAGCFWQSFRELVSRALLNCDELAGLDREQIGLMTDMVTGMSNSYVQQRVKLGRQLDEKLAIEVSEVICDGLAKSIKRLEAKSGSSR